MNKIVSKISQGSVSTQTVIGGLTIYNVLLQIFCVIYVTNILRIGRQ